MSDGGRPGALSTPVYDALGFRFTVTGEASARVEVARFYDAMRAGTARCDGAPSRYTIERRDDGKYTIDDDGRHVGTAADRDGAVRALAVDVNASALGQFGGAAVHAGAVAADDAVVAFPAPSGAGKSTLTAACVECGFRYVSDEALCLDYESGQVVPYPKPLVLTSERDHRTEVLVAPRRIVGRGRPLRLRHVVLPVRGRVRERLEPLPRTEGLRALFELSFNHYKAPRATYELYARLAPRFQVWRVEYSEAARAARLLAAELGVQP